MTTARRNLVWTMVLVMALSLGTASAQETRYVATNGNDAWSGTLAAPNAAKSDGPFATLARARDEIRALKKAGPLPEGGVQVLLRGGIYMVDAALSLSAEDSGTVQAPVVYSAASGEEVRLVGGKVLTGFTPVSDPAILKRLEKAAHGKVLQVDLKALGVTDFGSPKGGGMELFFQDKPMTVSRWPNEGFVKIAEVTGGELVNVRGTKGDRIGKWVYEGDRPKRWAEENDLWVHGYWFWDWSDERHSVKTIDTAKRIIEVKKPYHGYGYRNGQWYYAFNLLSEIDAPGEWYVDRESGILYFWPPAPIDAGVAMVSVTPGMVSMDGVSHLTLRGLTFEAARGTAITMSGGTANRVIACTIRNMGSRAVSISGGTNHGVVGCDIYGMGGACISLNGGARKTLTPAGHFADNNHIHHYARWYRMYNTAVSLNGVGNRATHNYIHDAPHMALGFSGNDHLIEFNEIHDVCHESNDAGAIYAGRDWTMRGTVIRHNYMHDIVGFEDRGCVGVYLDDMFSGTHIYGNLFHKVYRAAFIGGGRDNRVERNLFIDCIKGLHIDNRAQGWAKGSVNTVMKERLDAMPYTDPLWVARYPKLLGTWEDEPAAPKGNIIRSNVAFGEKWVDASSATLKYQLMDANLVDQDPLFVTPERVASGKNPRATDFALKPGSPAYSMGFEPLLLDKMGLYKSPLRASWPVER